LSREDVLTELANEISERNITGDCDMSRLTSFKAGGRAFALVCPENAAQLKKTLQILARSGVSYTFIGNGTNTLVTDAGYQGVIVKIGEAFSEIRVDGEEITAGAGALLSSVSNEAQKNGLAGLEFAAGIPGSMGGAVFMNAGAYENEMKNIVKCVSIISKDGENEYALRNEEMRFEYRKSILHATGDAAVAATLKLERGDGTEIREKMREYGAIRERKQPLSLPSAGSFFKRPAGHYAGKLIEDAGLKGLTVGGASVSELHAGFIVNGKGATATDIIDLMKVIQLTVRDRFGVALEPEVRIIGD